MIFVICLEGYVPLAFCYSKQGSQFLASGIYNLKPLIKINMMNHVSTSEELHNKPEMEARDGLLKKAISIISELKKMLPFLFTRVGR